jgi:hypothetical protein
MLEIPAKPPVNLPVAPPLVPKDFAEMLLQAEETFAIMGGASLDVIGSLADSVSASARRAGAYEIADAADSIRRIACGGSLVTLTGAMHDLAEAVSRERCRRQISSP